MRKASRQITRFYDDHLEPAGLRITQFLILAALGEADGATVNVLAERLDIERTAMGKMIGFLERDGFVSIKPSPLDGRVRIVELTKEGRLLRKRAEPLWERAQQEFEQLNGAANVATLRRGLREIAIGDSAKVSSED
ncbi:MarR family winged helix-turn-helix transcriptional regulator [Rhizobium calliandrae]